MRGSTSKSISPEADCCYFRPVSLSNPNTTARAALSSSRSISGSPKVRVSGCPQNSPIRSARSRSAFTFSSFEPEHLRVDRDRVIGTSGRRPGGVPDGSPRHSSRSNRDVRGWAAPRRERYAVPCCTAFTYSRVCCSQSRIDRGVSLLFWRLWFVYVTAAGRLSFGYITATSSG